MVEQRPKEGLDPADLPGTRQLFDPAYTRELLDTAGLDAVVATSPAQVCLVSGYSTWLDQQLRTWMFRPDGGNAHRAGFAVLTRDGPAALAVSPLFRAEAEVQASVDKVVSFPRKRTRTDDDAIVLVNLLRDLNVADGRIGVEFDGAPPDLRGSLAAAVPAAEIRDCSVLLRLMRSRKSDEAVQRLREVAGITERALLELKKAALPFAAWTDHFRRGVTEEGADFDHIVYGLSRGGLGRTLPAGMPTAGCVYVDGGAKKNHFLSDTGVTFATGRDDAVTRRRYRLAREALLAGADKLAPGVRSSSVHSAMAAVATQTEGLHVQGHGLGLDIRELPLIGPDPGRGLGDETIELEGDLELAPGMVVNLEVAEFFDDGASIQIEETFLLTATGAAPLIDVVRDEPWDFSPALQKTW